MDKKLGLTFIGVGVVIVLVLVFVDISSGSLNNKGTNRLAHNLSTEIDSSVTIDKSSLTVEPYINKEKNIKIYYPKDWTPQESADAETIIMFLDKEHTMDIANVTVFSKEFSDLDDGIKVVEDTFNNAFASYKRLDVKSIKVNGRNAKIVSSEANVTSSVSTKMLWMVIKDGSKNYVVSGVSSTTAWEKNKTTIENSILSLEFL